MENGPSPEQLRDVRVVGVATGLGCSIVAALVLCIGGGIFLDRQFGTSPVLTLIGVVLGLAAAGYQLWELAKLGSTNAQAGPVTRQIVRLPLARQARSAPQPERAGRENGRNEE